MLATGVIVDGRTTDVAGPDTGHADIGLGVLASASSTWLPVFEQRRRPFVLLSAAVSVSTTTAVSDDGEHHRLTAADGRLGLMIGKTLGDRIVPYASGRVFSGPVSFTLGGDSVTGSDAHKFAAGGGVIVRLPDRFDAFAEAMIAGERSASAGVTVSF